MTKLIVTPIDMQAPGSYRQRQRFIYALASIQDAGEGEEGASIVKAMLALDDLVVGQLATDDGTPVEDALAQLSANEFDQLMAGLFGQPTVPNSNSAPSS